MPNTTTERAGMTTTKVSADFASTVKAIIIAPITTKGERSSRRSVRFKPFCTLSMSLVRRVIRVEEPMPSSCEYEKEPMRSNTAWRSFLTKEVEALAAKYWAVIEKMSPTAPSSTSTPHIRMI